MLLQLREYINREQVVSTQQLSREFGLDLPALQPMLDLWVRKGAIAKCQEQATCQSTCFKCREKPPEYYRCIAI
ncbi:MAG: FeoC-like transcriptional regulator [Legionellales bacterium]